MIMMLVLPAQPTPFQQMEMAHVKVAAHAKAALLQQEIVHNVTPVSNLVVILARPARLVLFQPGEILAVRPALIAKVVRQPQVHAQPVMLASNSMEITHVWLVHRAVFQQVIVHAKHAPTVNRANQLQVHVAHAMLDLN